MTTNRKMLWIFAIIAAVGVVGYLDDANSRSEAARRARITTVWIPHPASGRRIPYTDVQIISQGRDFVKFRTKDGQVIEQHGDYGAETRQRTTYDPR